MSEANHDLETIRQEFMMRVSRLWREDLLFLNDQILSRHANPHHRISREQLDGAVDVLLDRIPQLERHQIIVEMSRILAMIGDGHTTLWLTANPSLKFHQYPVRLYQFSDGVFVYEATDEFRDYLGMRLIRVRSCAVEDALERVRGVLSSDNSMGLKQSAPHALSVPEVLDALGLIDGLDCGEFTFEDAEGQRCQVRLPMLDAEAACEWIRLCDNDTLLALRMAYPERLYWFAYLEAEQLVYVQHRAVGNMEDEPFAAFCERLFSFIEAHPVERLVIDLRNNSGGNNTLNQALVHGLICCRKINQRGKLYTLIGRRTFSAAMNLAVDLERNTKTLFVGEPTGSSPNFYGETTHNVLPRSGVTFSISSLYWQSSLPYDKRPWIEPHIPTEMRSIDYRNNVDPALDAVLSYVHDDALHDYEPVKYPD